MRLTVFSIKCTIRTLYVHIVNLTTMPSYVGSTPPTSPQRRDVAISATSYSSGYVRMYGGKMSPIRNRERESEMYMGKNREIGG